MPSSRKEKRVTRQENAEPNDAVRRKAVDVLRTLMMAIALVLIVVPVCFVDWEPESFSPADNKMKSDIPAWNDEAGDLALAFKDYAGRVDSFLEDRIGFRAELVASYGLLNDKFFGVMTHPLYEYGKDGYTFFRFSDAAVSDEYLESFAAYVKSMQDYCQQRGIAFLFALSPAKMRVYSDEIPDTVSWSPTDIERLKAYLDEFDIEYVDQGDAVIEAKQRGVQVFNKVYDAGHWNSDGMFAGAQAIVDRLQELGFDVDDIDIANYYRANEQQKVLPASNYPIDEQTFKYQLADPSLGAELIDGFMSNLAVNSSFRTTSYFANDNHPNDLSVLMMQGSYYNTQGTMLQHQFDSFARVHSYQNIFSLPYYIDVFDPDIVIFENADYVYSSNYYRSDWLAELDLPEVFGNVADLPVVSETMGPALTFDPESTIVNFSVDTSSIGDTEGSGASAYVLIGDRILDTVSNRDGIFWWGVKTSELEEAREAVVVIVCSSRQYVFACPLEKARASAKSLEEGEDSETSSIPDLVREGTWLEGISDVPFCSVVL